MLRILSCIALGLCTMGCPKPCDDGDSFSEVKLDNSLALQPSSTSLDVRYSGGTGWGAALPDRWYSQCSPVADGGAAACQLVESGHLRVTLAQPLGTHASVSLEFPDRSTACSCRHLGAPDQYFLHLDVIQGDGGYQLTANESIDRGPI